MQVIINQYPDWQFSYPLSRIAKEEDLLFFDIETTGLSPKTASIYLLGCAYFDNHIFTTKKWFLEHPSEEQTALVQFFSFLQSFQTLIHFNGNHFDIPFVRERAKKYHLSCALDEMDSYDIFLEARPLKYLLGLPSFSQKSIEDFLQIHREDPYDGGELIAVYRQYLKCGSDNCLKKLLLHNEEDLLGMTKVIDILHYHSLSDCQLTFQTMHHNHYIDFHGIPQEELLLKYTHDATIPVPFKVLKENLFLSCTEESLCFRIPLSKQYCKMYYENYKDYMFLLKENRCIHKSLASCVDKAYLRKAAREDCYEEFHGTVVPLFAKNLQPLLRKNYKDTQYFLPYTALDGSPEVMECYARQLLLYFQKKCAKKKETT